MMSEASLDRLLILFSAGIGFMVLGGLNFLLSRMSRPLRFSVGGCAAFAWSLAPLALASPQVSVISASIVLLGLIFLVAVSSMPLDRLLRTTATLARHQTVQAGILIGVGVVMSAGSLTHFESEEEAVIDRDLSCLLMVPSKPPLHVSQQDVALTDTDHPIEMKTPDEARSQSMIDGIEKQALVGMGIAEHDIRLHPASDMSNCHGWVFTGGRYWLSPEDVEQVLNENGYQAVSDPRAGDVVIYRQGNVISHTAVVHSNLQAGSTLVEGKWGWMGVFVHRIDESPYGKVHEFYRSTRHGHMLRGLGEHHDE